MVYEEFKNETLHIFTLVTGPYTNFFDNFIRTIGFFFPDNKKIVHVFSDGLMSKNGAVIDDGMVTIETTKIIDLPFPLVPLQKTFIQKSCVTDDMHYVFYFDIDTIFLERDDIFWDKIFNKFENDGVLLSVHPHYHSDKIVLLWNLIEQNKSSMAYIPSDEEPETRIISSFWGGKHDDVLKMCDYVNGMFKKDLGTIRYLPRFVDENYINKIIWQVNKGEITDLKFSSKEHLVETTSHYFNIETPYIFLLQKYDIKIKESKKRVD